MPNGIKNTSAGMPVIQSQSRTMDRRHLAGKHVDLQL